MSRNPKEHSGVFWGRSLTPGGAPLSYPVEEAPRPPFHSVCLGDAQPPGALISGFRVVWWDPAPGRADGEDLTYCRKKLEMLTEQLTLGSRSSCLRPWVNWKISNPALCPLWILLALFLFPGQSDD